MNNTLKVVSNYGAPYEGNCLSEILGINFKENVWKIKIEEWNGKKYPNYVGKLFIKGEDRPVVIDRDFDGLRFFSERDLINYLKEIEKGI